MALSLAQNDAGSNLVGEHEQLGLRLFERLGVYKRNPPERAYYREYLDLAIGTVEAFYVGGHNVKASTLHHVGLHIYMIADETGKIDGAFGTSKAIAAHCRLEAATVRRALQVLRKLCLFAVRKARGPHGITRWVNVGGLTIPAARRRWEAQRAGANLCPADTDSQLNLCPADTTKGYDDGPPQARPQKGARAGESTHRTARVREETGAASTAAPVSAARRSEIDRMRPAADGSARRSVDFPRDVERAAAKKSANTGYAIPDFDKTAAYLASMRRDRGEA